METITTKGAVNRLPILCLMETHGPQQTIEFGRGGKLELNIDGSGYSGRWFSKKWDH